MVTPGRTRSRLIGSVSESFWTADAMLIGLLVFFIVVGAMDPLDSLPLAMVLFVLLGLWVAHALSVRHGGSSPLEPSSRRIRERRGF
jgi:hypothetical protein